MAVLDILTEVVDEAAAIFTDPQFIKDEIIFILTELLSYADLRSKIFHFLQKFVVLRLKCGKDDILSQENKEQSRPIQLSQYSLTSILESSLVHMKRISDESEQMTLIFHMTEIAKSVF